MLDDLGPLAEVIGMTPGRELVPFIERILGDLLEDQRFGGQLIDTLHAVFADQQQSRAKPARCCTCTRRR